MKKPNVRVSKKFLLVLILVLSTLGICKVYSSLTGGTESKIIALKEEAARYGITNDWYEAYKEALQTDYNEFLYHNVNYVNSIYHHPDGDKFSKALGHELTLTESKQRTTGMGIGIIRNENNLILDKVFVVVITHDSYERARDIIENKSYANDEAMYKVYQDAIVTAQTVLGIDEHHEDFVVALAKQMDYFEHDMCNDYHKVTLF